MSRIAYVNGSYVRHQEAAVHIEDRGFQFADAVYEVIYVHQGHLVDAKAHLDRLGRSMNMLEMDPPMSRGAMQVIIKEMVRRNLIKSGTIYIQVTRGQAPRDFAFPTMCDSTLVMTAKRLPPFDLERALKPIKVKTAPDIRWKRCDIKTVGLLPAAMTKQGAIDLGYDDAWMVDQDGFVTEGTSNNAWIVTKDDKLITRAANHQILNGITRMTILDLARDHKLTILERPFSVEEAYQAKEAFVTSASAVVKPVTGIDTHTINKGKVGKLTRALASYYNEYLDKIARS